jgi:nitroreductase
MDTLEAIRHRRSIRQQKSDPIDETTLNKILEAARWAQSSGNNQEWRFIVVSDKDIKAQLQTTRPKRATPQPQPIVDAPVVIAVVGELNKAGFSPDGTPHTDKGGNWYLFDTGVASQNICLAAHSLGLGTVIIGNFDSKRAAEILKVPKGFDVVVLIPVGYPVQPIPSIARKELSEIVFKDTFGNE